MLIPTEGMVSQALRLRFPASVPSEAGWFAEWATEAQLPAGEHLMTFYWTDDFTGQTAGYHFLQVLVDDAVVWEQDVAGVARTQRVEFPFKSGAGAHTVALRLYEKRAVENFPVTAHVAGLVVRCGGRELALLPLERLDETYQEYPPEIPLPKGEVCGEWTRNANIVQPWGKTQSIAMLQADEWVPRFVDDFGFDAIIMLPPASHNRVPEGEPFREGGISEEDFQRVVEKYRNAGMKLILYTSVMHVGHAPQWQFGSIAEKHPEWAQRDRDGGVCTRYGYPWLCPATGALAYTAQYTADLVRKYGADAVMLDNNQFINSNDGKPMCYCESCRRQFREYVIDRFGEDGVRDILGMNPDQIDLPTSDLDKLWGLWLSWRKRLWAEALETYRVELRKINPDMVVLANTQYMYRYYVLGVDEQYAHEDAVLAESCSLNGAGMAAKMTLGRALAKGRPLWNYIGTFDETDHTLLRPADEVQSVCAASVGAGANPWIVFYGFTGEENEASKAVLTKYMAFWASYADLLVGEREAAATGMVFSPESRDFTSQPMPPQWLADLLDETVAVRGLWEPNSCPPEDLEGLKVVMAPLQCIRRETAERLADWVRAGGTLITTPWSGWCDEHGRWRDESAISVAVGENVSAPGEHSVDNGTIVCIANEADSPAEVLKRVAPDASGDGAIGAFRRVSADGRQVLALVGFDGALGTVTATIPGADGNVEVYVPGQDMRTVKTTAPGRVELTVDEALAVVVW